MRAWAVVFLGVVSVAFGGVEEDWARIVSLDAGPKKQPSSAEEVRLFARNHFLIHRKALEEFVAKYPGDPRVVDARLRLAGIHAAEGAMDSDDRKVAVAVRMLAEIEANESIPRGKRADAAFLRASVTMQSLKDNTSRVRETIVGIARGFAGKFPGDVRGPRLLVEAATICDDVPATKRELLEEALRLTTEEPLRRRIADDFTRLDLLGKPLDLELKPLGGTPLALASLRGKPVVVIFWSVESPHSLLWLRNFRIAYQKLPTEKFHVVTVALDADRAAVAERAGLLGTRWPVHFDGMGWESPLARKLGINALPSVWIVDASGVLRTINAKETYTTWINQLTR